MNNEKIELKLRKLKEKAQRVQTNHDEKVADCKRDCTIYENNVKILKKKIEEYEAKREKTGLTLSEFEDFKLVQLQYSISQKALRKALKRYSKAQEKRDQEISKIQRRIDDLKTISTD